MPASVRVGFNCAQLGGSARPAYSRAPQTGGSAVKAKVTSLLPHQLADAPLDPLSNLHQSPAGSSPGKQSRPAARQNGGFLRFFWPGGAPIGRDANQSVTGATIHSPSGLFVTPVTGRDVLDSRHSPTAENDGFPRFLKHPRQP